MQPEPAAVTACRYVQSCTSPAEHAGNVRCAGARASLDVVVRMKFDLLCKDFGVWRVPDGDEERVGPEIGEFAGLDILRTNSRNLVFVDAKNFYD